ncbi:hypothetical protein [Amycolatopsis albispora]|uniref:Uncharacterized protein n=1 Tax=Amycolatopsis albispora TaxID=1804986 RepID=A0A344L6K1_9PSEU|nr:hypothetical protein [Amycolatopsis albispora]AXB43675.1 hypothetical protein A4R43_14945 [Amycolatopsis albispora]
MAETDAPRERVLLAPHATERPGLRRRAAVLAVAVAVLSVLAVGAWASPGQPGAQQPPDVPVPPVDTCAPSSEPWCQLPTATTPPSIPAVPLPPITELPPPPTCAPGQVGCSPGAPPAPCTGEDCIPQPTPQASGSVPPPGGTGSNPSDPECGLSNIPGCLAKALNTVFRDLVNAALDPILELLGNTALTTPTLDQLPGIGELWNSSWEIVLAAYGMLVLVAGIVVMSHESVQNRYSIKEIGPRIPIGFLASALSLFFAEKFIRLANALSSAVLGDGVDPPSLATTLKDALDGALSGGLFLIFVAVALVVIGLGLLIVYVVRVALTLILIITAPLFLMCHCLPHTDPLARWWWKAIGAVLAIQVAQSLVLITAVRTFLAGGTQLFSSTLSALGTLISAIALFYILFKIPFWFLSATKLGNGRSFLGGLAKAYIAAKTFGMVAGKTGTSVKAAVASTSRSSLSAPPRPAQPLLAPTPAAVSKRVKAAYDAEQTRAARRSRLPSQRPQFLQPTPQEAVHDPAVIPVGQVAAKPTFSSPPRPATPVRPSPGPQPIPRFRAAGTAHPVDGERARPVAVAAVPPHLRFQPPSAEPSHTSTPIRPATPPPPTPVFRPAHPEPRIGDARPRTPSVPPVAFRAPSPPTSPPRGGSTS